MRSLVLSTARPVAAALAVLLAAPPAFARTIRCESGGSRYTYCPVETYGNVTLRNELSRYSCQYGRGWGYDRHGVWVDRGCRAEFAVDEGWDQDAPDAPATLSVPCHPVGSHWIPSTRMVYTSIDHRG